MSLIKSLLTELVLGMVSKPWFQAIIANEMIKVINDSENKVDNAVYDFIFRNKRDLLAIAKRESKLTTTQIDDNVVEALQIMISPVQETVTN